MPPKLRTTELLTAGAGFALVSAATVDAGLLLAARAGGLDVPPGWYVNAPLLAWTAAGVPLSLALLERMYTNIAGHRPTITASLADAGPTVSRIPFTANGKTGSLLASVAPSIFGETLPEEPAAVYRPAAWRVTVDGLAVVVRESELRAFLEVAAKRPKHQFSRRYWTRRRRPALYMPKYLAMMTLLKAAGLVDGRHDTGRASGRLVTTPRHAITYLKHESAFRAA